MRRGSAPVWISLIVVALVATAWVSRDSLFEQVEVETERAPTGDAKTHTYLALETLLTEIGLPTQPSSGLSSLPESDHVVWWLAATRSRSTERLLEWVEQGGHLIVLPVAGSDAVLEAAGIGIFFEDEADEDDHLSPQEFQIERPEWPKFYLLERDESQERVEVVASEGELDAAWNLTVKRGKGLVTAINDAEFLTNAKLAEADHALLAWYLVYVDEGRQGVHLVLRDPKPSVWLVLGARAWPVAISLMLLMFAGLWAFARRQGPIQPSPSRDRRHLAEHLRATGAFLWQVGCEDALLAAQRSAVASKLKRRGAALGSRDQNLMREAMAAAGRSGLDPQAVAHALKIRELRDRERFVGVVRLLEDLRRDRET